MTFAFLLPIEEEEEESMAFCAAPCKQQSCGKIRQGAANRESSTPTTTRRRKLKRAKTARRVVSRAFRINFEFSSIRQCLLFSWMMAIILSSAATATAFTTPPFSYLQYGRRAGLAQGISKNEISYKTTGTRTCSLRKSKRTLNRKRSLDDSSFTRLFLSSSTTTSTTTTPMSTRKQNDNDNNNDSDNNDHDDDIIQPAATKKQTPSVAAALDGLSKFHQSILLRTATRQRFVTGRYPLTVTCQENPTRKWLAGGSGGGSGSGGDWSTDELLVNGTTPARSLASLDRFLWIEDETERALLLESYAMVSLELLAVIHTERPGYLQILDHRAAGSWIIRQGDHDRSISSSSSSSSSSRSNSLRNLLPQDRLWVTGFSLAGSKGMVKAVECDTGAMTSVNRKTAKDVLWPNEVQAVPASFFGSREGTVQALQLSEQHHQYQHYREENASILTAVVAVKEETKTEQSLYPVVSPTEEYQDALLVCDGFLVPGKDFGGIYVVRNPGHPERESTICLTSDSAKTNAAAAVTAAAAASERRRASLAGISHSNAATASTRAVVSNNNNNDRWFYHRAVWVDLTGDGRQSILTARCRVSTLLDRDNDVGIMSGITKSGELVWLECPQAPADDDGTFDPLEHTPWKTHILARSPDVMFSVADLDPTDDTIEVLASEFFPKRVSLHSIQRGKKPRVTFSRSIDDHCGAAFGSILADLDCVNALDDDDDASNQRIVVDCGSTVKSLEPGDSFSHLLVTSHECSFAESERNRINGQEMAESSSTDAIEPKVNPTSLDGGSLFAYRVPDGLDAWKTKPWPRTTVATGFKVKGQLGNMINPGAPGFVYTFHAKKEDRQSTKRPMIAVAGDCAESAYVFRPEPGNDTHDASTRYKLMVEIKCGATVGSIGIGYDDFTSAEQESGYAKLYIPCFEKDRIHVFALGKGEDDDGW